MSRFAGIDTPQKLRALPEGDLPELCADLRGEIISVCGKVGGHLGASLGAVELIVALHKVFKSPHDKLVFDVGHQAYAHKLLTGRRARMSTLRQAGGVSPFLDPAESPHDALLAGHACTAVSAALGMLEANRLQRDEHKVVAVIGDGSLTGGLTFEGLNNAGAAASALVVVLNDNQMSISKNVGAINTMLRTQSARTFFEALGFTYLGPVDGHDLGALVDAFEKARRARRPILVHAHTLKGKGLAEAESDALTRGHAMGPFELRDGKLVRSRGGQRTYSEAFADAVESAMARDPRVVVVTPAMVEGSALNGVKSRFGDRVIDVGIAEQHAVTFAAGLAARGMRPVCCIYSTFLQRAYDQVVHDVVLPGLPVVFAIDRAGLVGADGATHQGAYDISFLRPLPTLRQYAPVVAEDLAAALEHALGAVGPAAIRFPRGTLPTSAALPSGSPDRARWLQQVAGAKVALVAFGPLAVSALQAAAGRPWSVLDARTLPLDEEAVLEAGGCGAVVTVEEGTTRGGFGAAVLELFARARLSPRVTVLGLPDAFVPHGDARAQRSELGLDAEGIRRAAEDLAS